jgi:hypothetical protein
MEEGKPCRAIAVIAKQRFYTSLPALSLSLEGRSPSRDAISKFVSDAEKHSPFPHWSVKLDAWTSMMRSTISIYPFLPFRTLNPIPTIEAQMHGCQSEDNECQYDQEEHNHVFFLSSWSDQD